MGQADHQSRQSLHHQADPDAEHRNGLSPARRLQLVGNVGENLLQQHALAPFDGTNHSEAEKRGQHPPSGSRQVTAQHEPLGCAQHQCQHAPGGDAGSGLDEKSFARGRRGHASQLAHINAQAPAYGPAEHAE